MISPTLLDAIPILPYSDLTETLAFYSMLGFAKVMQSGAYAIVRRDGAELHFSPQPAEPALAAVRCCLRVASTDALFREFTSRGMSLDAPTERDWYVTELRVVDPNGNVLMFAEPIEDRTLQFEARR
jgi:hypothetical protein